MILIKHHLKILQIHIFEVAKKLIESVPLEKESTLFIGDSVHDWEVAENIGCQCILIADGHQSIELLKTTEAYVISHIEDILKIFT